MILCPFCGARYQAPPGRKFYVCPYCGTVVSEGKTYQSVYIFKPRADKTAAFRAALNLKPTGSPDDLPQATPTAAELHFLPLYLYHADFFTGTVALTAGAVFSYLAAGGLLRSRRVEK